MLEQVSQLREQYNVKLQQEIEKLKSPVPSSDPIQFLGESFQNFSNYSQIVRAMLSMVLSCYLSFFPGLRLTKL